MAKTVKKVKKKAHVDSNGVAHIKATFNNVLVTITDPPFTVVGTVVWQALHSATVPLWPCTAMLWVLSSACRDGYSAWVEP